VFSEDGGKSPLAYFRLRKTLQKAMVAIGISLEDQKSRGLGLHAFRHWVNTSLRGKVSDDIIRAMTGHVTEEMTEHYTSHRLEDLSPIVNVIQAVFEDGKARVAR
jgi:integrase